MQLFGVLLLQALTLQDAQPDIASIRAAVFQRLAHDAARQVQGVQWMKERTDIDVTEPPRVHLERRERYSVWGDGQRMLQQSIWRDAVPISGDVEPLSIFVEPKLFEGFDFYFATPNQIACGLQQVCWRIGFSPKQQEPQRSGDIERQLLESSTGVLLVEQLRYGILRVDAHIIRPYKSWKVDIPSFALVLIQREVDSVMVTESVEFTFSFKKLFGSLRTQTRFYSYSSVALPPS